MSTTSWIKITDKGGHDTVYTTSDYTLTDGLEDLSAEDVSLEDGLTLTGNELDNRITGNAGGNFLYGHDGFDTLVGNGGHDHLDGGADDDSLDGGEGNDVLKGGTGADTLNGGIGSDTYYVDSLGDQVIDDVNDAGIDTIITSISYSIENRQELEHLTANPEAGRDSVINLTGNANANRLTGHIGDNSLSGSGGNDTLIGNGGEDTLNGGTGADLMVGGSGNDTFYIDDDGDRISEVRTGGTKDTGGDKDTVISSRTFALNDTNLAFVENLTVADNAVGVTLTGNSGRNIITGNTRANTLIGAAGNDSLVGNAGDDELYGGSDDDTLSGGADNDILNGGTGVDSMAGGSGNDTYWVDSEFDIVDETDGAGNDSGGTDTVHTTKTYSLESRIGVEHMIAEGSEDITLTGNGLGNQLTGNSGNNIIQGNGGNDTLVGNDGNDELIGGTGVDKMFGGKGSDTYWVDSEFDEVDETDGTGADSGGTDIVHTDVSYSIENRIGVEHMVAEGGAGITLTGNNLGNNLTGNSGNNTLIGNGGDDILNGGVGEDTMRGGIGDDTYFVDNPNDVIIENASEMENGKPVSGGRDTIYTSASYKLAEGVSVEVIQGTGQNALQLEGNEFANSITGVAQNDTLLGGGGNDTLIGSNGDDDLSGGSESDSLIGGIGDDTLDGGTGADTLAGGDGGDTYYVDNANDKITETGSGGRDTVITTRSWTLGGGLEDLEVLNSGSETDLDLTGNELANKLTGNDGDNVLDGKAGADTMTGGGGDDTYKVDDAGDVINEDDDSIGGGVDTVVITASNITHTMATGVDHAKVEDDLEGVQHTRQLSCQRNHGQ